jgi:hypothetical protein
MTHDKGRAYFGDLSYGGRHFSFGANYQDLSAGFRAPLGFIQRVDVRKASQYAGYYFYPENSRILSFGSTASVGANWDRNGRSTDRYSNIDFRMDFAGPAGFSVSRYDAYENYLQQDYRYHANSATIYLSHIRSITFFGSYAAGTGINYSSPGTPFLGRTQNGSAGFTWRPAARIRLEQFYYNSRFRTALTSLDPGSAVFINHLARTKINFQFTKALSLREIVDYDALSPNDALYLGEHYKRVTSDILLTYLLKPGAAVYVGYNNRFENLTADPDSAPPLRRFGLPSYPTTRQFYVKLSYLLQF